MKSFQWSAGITVVLLSLVFVDTAFAQLNPHLMASGIAGCDFPRGDIQFQCFPNYVAFLVKTVFGFIGTICLLQIMFAGYEIAKGSLEGDKEGGKKRLRNALVGFVFSLLCFAVVDMIVGIVV